MADAPPPVAIRLTRPYETEDEFLAQELELISKTSITLVGAQPRPQGVVLRFELVLTSGHVLVRGEGRVVGFKPNVHRGVGGLTLRFTRIDARSKALLNRAATMREMRRPSSKPPLAVDAPSPESPEAPAKPALEHTVMGSIADLQLSRVPAPPAAAPPAPAPAKPALENTVMGSIADLQLSRIPAPPAAAPSPQAATKPALENTVMGSIADLHLSRVPAPPAAPPPPQAPAKPALENTVFGAIADLQLSVPPVPAAQAQAKADAPSARAVGPLAKADRDLLLERLRERGKALTPEAVRTILEQRRGTS